MRELPEVALWRITWWEPPDTQTTHPKKALGGSSRWRGGANRIAEVVAPTMESAMEAVRRNNPTAVFTNAAKASGTGLFYVVTEETS